MSLTLLKYNAEILLEVSQNYDKLEEKMKTAKGEEKKKLEMQMKTLKGQILFLLTAIKKSEENA